MVGLMIKRLLKPKKLVRPFFVAGSYVFKGDVNERVQTLRKQLD